MHVIRKILSIVRLGIIDPGLMLLVLNVKRTKRTYLSYAALFSLVKSFLLLSKRSTQPLQVAEFGVGRGGSATILAWLVNEYKGMLTLYDLFGRIPAPTVLDGEEAINRYQYIVNDEAQDYYGNIPNLLEVVSADLHRVCPPERISIVQGKYEEKLPGLVDNLAFNLVHIDCDWYESSKAVYSYLEKRILPGAIIQIDDYSTWEGSKRAFEETTWLAPYSTHMVDGALVIDTSKIK